MSVGARASSSERESFPQLREDLGEDPARYLDVPMFIDGNREPPLFTAFARIRGIDRLEVANAWLAVERRLDRGPRDPVVEALEERIAYLEEAGERPGTVPTEEGPERYRRREIRDDVECEYDWSEQSTAAEATLGDSA